MIVLSLDKFAGDKKKRHQKKYQSHQAVLACMILVISIAVAATECQSAPESINLPIGTRKEEDESKNVKMSSTALYRQETTSGSSIRDSLLLRR